MTSFTHLQAPIRRLGQQWPCSLGRRPCRLPIATYSSASASTSRPSTLVLTGVITAAVGLGYAACFAFPPQNSTLRVLAASFLPVPPQSPSPGSIEGNKLTQQIEHELINLPQVRELNNDPDWRSSRPFHNFPQDKAVHSLTAGALRGPGKLAVPPIVFVNKDDSEAIIFIHLGRSLCGHDGIVHGGLCATILDEALGRIALPNLPSKIGVTASLKLNYKSPTFADQFVVLKTRVSPDPSKRPTGRKVWVEGRIENLKGQVLVEAEALFVEPRAAALLKNSMVNELIS
ncbi:hypothetical protein CROQUDRAFT_655320 [Cronartium quercuum f. sp. fusiforme G11]|uniref:Thioesterase domain-containing protein n=1 Tax=Cronartium quercuum f. sp. fusiforme G11 TaxID=708437 RepID=A0A9P6TDV3_9BASI|nr:hypothetical protein CROQUDRAFT_655320 [Cronartium quercuum f. sp. fusiforme G11]